LWSEVNATHYSCERTINLLGKLLNFLDDEWWGKMGHEGGHDGYVEKRPLLQPLFSLI
jgi:hypothetical protein